MATRGRALGAHLDARYSLVAADDLCTACLAAAAAAGRRGFLPIVHERPLSGRELFQALGAACGRRVRVVELPLGAAAATALAAEVAARLRGRPAVFGWDKYRELRAGSWVGDPVPAAESLGFRAVIDHAEGFAETLAWYRARGWIRPDPSGGRA